MIRDRAFLGWAKQRGGFCCLCLRLRGEQRIAEHLHHWGERGIGQKCHDYEIARVCSPCHAENQGKRRLAYLRTGDIEVLEALTRDALDLLIAYVAERSSS